MRTLRASRTPKGAEAFLPGEKFDEIASAPLTADSPASFRSRTRGDFARRAESPATLQTDGVAVFALNKRMRELESTPPRQPVRDFCVLCGKSKNSSHVRGFCSS